MKWIWDGGFRAHKRNDDGTVTEKVFSSQAQARQHVEQHEDCVLADRVKPTGKNRNRDMRKQGNHRPPVRLTAEQTKARDAALKQFKGL